MLLNKHEKDRMSCSPASSYFGSAVAIVPWPTIFMY